MFFFFNDTATTEIYTLSLHDALPICIGSAGGGSGAILRSVAFAGSCSRRGGIRRRGRRWGGPPGTRTPNLDRKSTRLNSSHANISYAVFCLKKKIKIYTTLVCYRTHI